jgi:mannose-6-phosphate isomerase-like protein (cupin superfamily)
MATNPYYVLRADDVEPFVHPEETGYASQHIIGTETSGPHDLLLNRGTVKAGRGLHGTNHPVNDELYYIVRGSSDLDLGGDPDTGEGGKTYRVDEGMVVMIPAGTFHRLRNDTEDDLVILTVWPQQASRGANGIHDMRMDTWGEGFRLRPGLELASDGDARRVVDRAAGWDPLVS